MSLLAVPFAVAAVAGTASAAPVAPAHHTHHAAAGSVVVTTEHTKFGTVLVTSAGESLYVFSGDGFPFSATGTPQLACTALNKAANGTPCTTAWPPLVASGPLVAKGGVVQKGLGTVTRNGVTQVTYFGQPVYGFINDKTPNAVNGEDVAAFDGTWYLDHPSGKPAAEVPTVTTEVSPNGIVLSSTTASGGRTLYLLTADSPRTSACTGPCAALWPPLLTPNGRSVAGTGTSARLLGTIRRADGTLQVTYNRHPVYFFALDLGAGAAAGLTNGEYLIDPAPVDGNWYTVSPQGIPTPGTTTVGSEASGGSNILSITAGLTHVTATLYAFSADTATASKCTGMCAMIWPPVITSTPAAFSGMVNGAQLGTIQRADGTFQVTYNSHPLYFFAKALDSGTEGNNVTAFGGTFTTVNVSGAVG
jgi:predicted lipoprotein with Yx(FWY)xxD motif